MQAVAGGMELPCSTGDPGPAEPGSRPAPRRSMRAPGCVAVAVQPLPEPGHPCRIQWRPRGSAQRLSQPATPSAFRALGASSPGPREMFVPSTASSTISSSLSMAAGDPAQLGAARLPPVPPGAPAAGRALGLSLASLEEEDEEEQSGLARTASPYSPFNSLAFSCCCRSRPPSLRLLAPLLRGSRVPPWPPPPQLSPVIPPLC